MRIHYLLIILVVFLNACGGRKISTGTAREVVTALPHEILEKDDVDVVYVTQTSGSSAVVESRVKTAFRLQKIDGKWVAKDIRIGNGQWERIEDLSAALTEVKTKQTALMLDRIATAVKEYHQATGSMPDFKDYIELSDILAPTYLDPLIRLDSWRNPLRAAKPDSNSILVVSAGPDGRFTTEDDIRLDIK